MDGSSSGVTPEANPLRIAVEEVVRHWKALVLVPIGTGIAAAGASFLFPREYEAVAIFSPAEDVTGAIPANLQSIAAQFGVGTGGPGYNVYYFAQVSQSREVQRLVAADTLEADGSRIAVTDLVAAGGHTEAERVDRAIRALRKRIRIGTDDQSELVTIRTRGPSPGLATALATSLLDALNQVTSASIQRGGSAERRFAQAQADSAREALRAAEDRLRDFYQANRSIVASPTLQVEEARLRRQIQIRQDLYLGLINQAEAAKLREVKNTPSISLVQPPQASPKKVWPRRAVWALFAIIGTLLGAAAWLYLIRPMLPTPRPARR